MSSSFDKKFNSLKVSLEQIKEATDNFGDENLIRKSGSGKIYKGKLLRSGKSIDIVARRFDPKSWRRRKEFMKEITMLSALKHLNLSTIVGFCDEDDEMIIITKFEAKGSLDQYLSDPTLTWTQRLHICIGIAEALSYIHYDKPRKFSVIHTNVKSSKILLDGEWEPKLFGFELSKMQVVARRQVPVLDRLISGTGAYVDPAYVKSGGVTHKSDVYSLGVVLFEVLCGRPAFVQAGKPDDAPSRTEPQWVTRDHPQAPKNDELVKGETSIEMGTTRSFEKGNTQCLVDLEYLAAKEDEPIQKGSQDLEHQARKHDELVTTGPMSRKHDELVTILPSTTIEARPHDQVGSLDIENQAVKHDENVTTDPMSSTIIEARPLDHVGSPDLEYQAGKRDEDVQPQLLVQMESQDPEYQEGKHDEHVTTGPLSSTTLEARSLDQMRSLEYQTKKHEVPTTILPSIIIEARPHDQVGSLDIQNQPVKNDESVQPQLIVRMGSLDRGYSGNYDEHFTMRPPSSTTIETQSLDQMGSLNIKYQIEKHDELVTVDLQSSTMKEDLPIDQTGKHDEYTQSPSISQTGALDLDLQARKHYAYAQPLLQPPSVSQEGSMGLKYQAGKHDELYTVGPPSRSMIEPSLSITGAPMFDQTAPSSSNMGPAPGFTDIVRPDNISAWNNAANTEAGYSRKSHISVEEENYMRSLQQLHIPEDGLLAKLAKSHYENKTLDDIIHPHLRKQMDPQSLKKYSEAAYCCLNDQRAQRPNIDRVILALKQALAFQLEHENSASKEMSTVTVKGSSTNQLEGKDFEHLKIGYEAIKSATENFAQKYYLGRGGYGIVYKAELEHYDSSVLKDNEVSELPKKSSTVAIKYILKREGPEGEKGFIAEIATLSSCKHPNIVSLLGFCHEDSHMILVYEFVSNGSLADYLGNEGKMTNLTWAQRIKICIDIACGLDYVHTPMNEKGNKKRKIIHGDIKSANILLDEILNVKIADFGLSRLQPLNHTYSTIVTGTVVGTKMYWDPEYATSGHLKVESDVYSFGVVLFELMTGRLAYDPDYIKENDKGLAPIVRQNFEQGTLKEMVDPKLKEESDGYAFTLSKGPNKDSLHIFSKIGYQCLSEKQEERPKLKVVIKELEKALKLQETHKDSFRISLEDIRLATQNFSDTNLIGKGGFGRVYKGIILHDKLEPTPIAVKRLDRRQGQGEQEFLTEVEILFEYKHQNILSFVGYCDEEVEAISVFEYASLGSLDRHLNNPSLTWTKRLKICIDVATGLDFLHGGGSTQAAVIHRDIKSANILLTGDWKAKISDFGLSIITAIDDEMDIEFDEACGTHGYVEPQYLKQGSFTRESDIYSLGAVLFEIMCGRIAYITDDHGEMLIPSVKRHYEEGKLDELVFNNIKDMIVPESLTAFQSIAYECLQDEREKRPKASKVVAKLKEALEFQEDIEIWEAKLPIEYKEIIQMSKTPQKYSNMSNKDLYNTFSNGILLQKDKVLFSLSSNEERHEMVSATMFSYENNILHNKRIPFQDSRFQKVVKMMDISNLNIQIKIKTHFLTPNVIYGAHLVFKFCYPRKFSSKLMYVNLKYKMKGKTLNAYFATRGNDEWMMIELCRFIPHKKDVDFEVLLESLSQYYCGSGAIYVEGVHFQVINDATSDSVQQVSVDYEEITEVEDHGVELLSLSKADGKKCHMLPAKMVLYDTSDVNRFNWKSLAESRFVEAVELLSHQVLRIKCKIETQKLSADTDYVCYLVFKLSQQRHGLHCPVRVRDLLLRKRKESKFIYFRSPRVVNLHGNERVPKKREDGLMEVIVWEFKSGNNDDHAVPMSLKLRCYEGTMYGLIVYGIEFRPIPSV